MSAAEPGREPFERRDDASGRAGASPDPCRPAASSAPPPPPAAPSTDWWRERPAEQAPQWSLAELFLHTAAAATAASLARLVPPMAVSIATGVVMVLGWLRLHVDDWEPRWAVIAWRAVLTGYLVSTFLAMFR